MIVEHLLQWQIENGLNRDNEDGAEEAFFEEHGFCPDTIFYCGLYPGGISDYLEITGCGQEETDEIVECECDEGGLYVYSYY